MDYLARVVDYEIRDLLKWISAISIEGPKGVGKTETARRLAKTIRELDDPIIQEIAKADIQELLRGEKPILIDEWQRIPEIWDRIRRTIDKQSTPALFLLTGSASPTNPPTHTGAGRIVTVRMRPLALSERKVAKTTVSLTELLTGNRPFIEGNTDLRLADYVDEIIRSGFPGIRKLTGRSLRAQIDGYLMRIVDKDFRDLGLNLRNPEGLVRWMRGYAAATSTTTSFEKIRDASTGKEGNKPSKTTVLPYMDILEKLWILDPVPAWMPTKNHLTSLAYPPKHQLADPALAVQLLGLSEDSLIKTKVVSQSKPLDGTFLGNLFESLVTLSIRVLAQACEAKVKHLRTKGGKQEVDLIVERADQKIVAIEVKLKSTIDDNDVKNLKWLEKKIGEDLLDAVVINTGPIAYRRKDGIAVIPASLIGL